jgi:hypothetical protein
MRYGWASSEWAGSSTCANSIRSALDRELDRILPGTPEQRAQFIERSLEAIDACRHTGITTPTAPAATAKRWAKFAKSCSAGTVAISRLHADECELLELALLKIPSSGGEQDSGRDPPSLSEIAASPEGAALVAEAAARLASEFAASARRGRPERNPHLLLALIAAAYEAAFHARPSYSGEGTFNKALRLLLEAAGIRPLTECQLKRTLGRLPTSAPPPRPGRKPRVKPPDG